MFVRCSFALFAVLLLTGTGAFAQATPSRAPTTHVDVQGLPPIQAAVKAAPPFDAEKATDAYLATVKGQARANSDSYFEGGYYLLVIDTLYALAVSAILLWTRFSAWMRNVAAGFTRSRVWQAPIYAVQYVVATTILTFPLTLYEAFFREHAYGLSNQTFLQWFGDFSIQTALQIAVFAMGLSTLYAVIRRSPRYWWVWGTAIAVVFTVIGTTIEPVLIDPLFNTYKSLPESPLKDRILSLARANGIPAKDVYLFDASRQSKRISANVGGFMGTTRIALNDNLLNRTSQNETLAVLGHEMGHYVLDHSSRLIVAFGLVFLLGFWIAHRGFGWPVGIFGKDWDVKGIDDPAGFPVLFAIAVVFSFVMTPVTNTITRSTEAQADIFGLNAARQPDGFATVTLKLSEYRKLDPSPLEEALFYDHPSGRSRIGMSMRWKAEHRNDPDIKAGPVSPQ